MRPAAEQSRCRCAARRAIVVRGGAFADRKEIGYHPPREEPLMILERFKVPAKDQVFAVR